MIHLSPSKILDFLDTLAVNPASINHSQEPLNTSFTAPGAYANSISASADDLRWDEYGNPYIADSAVH